MPFPMVYLQCVTINCRTFGKEAGDASGVFRGFDGVCIHFCFFNFALLDCEELDWVGDGGFFFCCCCSWLLLVSCSSFVDPPVGVSAPVSPLVAVLSPPAPPRKNCRCTAGPPNRLERPPRRIGPILEVVITNSGHC